MQMAKTIWVPSACVCSNQRKKNSTAYGYARYTKIIEEYVGQDELFGFT